MLDATEGIGAQDLNILSIINDNKKSVVLAVNKWDLIDKDTKTANEYRKMLMEKLAPQDHIPIIFTSAIKRQRLLQVLEVVKKFMMSEKKIPTSTLNKIILMSLKNPPPLYKGKGKNKYCTGPHSIPIICIFAIHPIYKRTI